MKNAYLYGYGVLLSVGVMAACTSSKNEGASVSISIPAASSSAEKSQSVGGVNTLDNSYSSTLNPTTYFDATGAPLANSCFFIFASGPEAAMSGNSCAMSISSGGTTATTIPVGIVAGSYAPGSIGTLSVPAGANRSFYILGMMTDGSPCPTVTTFNSLQNHISNPRLIGTTSGVTLSSGQSLALNISVDQNLTATDTYIGNCNGPAFNGGTGGGGSGGGGVPTQVIAKLQDNLTTIAGPNVCVPVSIIIADANGNGASVSSNYTVSTNSASGYSLWSNPGCSGTQLTSLPTFNGWNTFSAYIQFTSSGNVGVNLSATSSGGNLSAVTSNFTVTSGTGTGVSTGSLVMVNTAISPAMTYPAATVSIPAFSCQQFILQLRDSNGAPNFLNTSSSTLTFTTAIGVKYYSDNLCLSGSSPSGIMFTGPSVNTNAGLSGNMSPFYFRVTNATPTFGLPVASGLISSVNTPSFAVSNYTSAPTQMALAMTFQGSNYQVPQANWSMTGGSCVAMEIAYIDAAGNRGQVSASTSAVNFSYTPATGFLYSDINCSTTLSPSSISVPGTSSSNAIPVYVRFPSSGTTLNYSIGLSPNFSTAISALTGTLTGL